MQLDERYAFAGAFDGWVEPATERLGVEPGPVLDGLRRGLVWRLSEHGAAALHELWEAIDPDRRRYAVFVGEGQSRLADAFPGFTPVAELIVEQWLASSAELVGRLGDRPVAPATDPEHVQLWLGDPHREGCSVSKVDFGEGGVWALKPRSTAPEAAFYDFVRDHPPPRPPPLPHVIDRGDHGWMSWLETGTVADGGAYSYATGWMLGLLHIAGAGDLHYENLVCAGPAPVPVDLEVMAVGRIVTEVLPTQELVTQSAIATGLLPRSSDGGGGPFAVEHGALLGGSGAVTGRWTSAWEALGTDRLGLTRELERMPAGPNVPRDENGGTVAYDAGEILAGYEAGLEAGVAGDATSYFADVAGRLVVRSTGLYAGHLLRAREPRWLEIEDPLAALGADLDPEPAQRHAGGDAALAERILEAEQRALCRLDVPTFWTRGHDLDCDGDVMAGVVSRTGQQRQQERVADLRDPHGSRRARDIVALTLPKIEPTGPRGAHAVSAADAAAEIAEVVASEAIRLGDDAVGWMTIETIGPSARPIPAVETGLYNGSSGIAVFLASAGVRSGRGDHVDLARAALRQPPARDEPRNLDRGAAGRAWCEAVVGVLSGDRRLLDQAVEVVGRLAVDEPAPNDPIDLLGGSGGVLASAVAIAGMAPQARAAAASIADRYVAELAARRDRPEGPPRTRAGTAHGSFGVSFALSGAAMVLGHEPSGRMRDVLLADEAALVAERGHVAARVSMKRQVQTADQGWCWGAAGFLLTRASPWMSDVPIDEQTVEATRAVLSGSGRLDQVCCGRAGVLEARTAADARWGEASGATDGSCIESDLAAVGPRAAIGENFTSVWSPGLFRGGAGVGLALLRTTDTSLPSPLSLQPPS